MVQLKVDAKENLMNSFSCLNYAQNVSKVLADFDWAPVELLTQKLRSIIDSGHSLYICGNGGSAGNADHLANDFLYGVSPKQAKSIRVEALTANSALLTCLGNDIGYENIFARQIAVKGRAGDVLFVLSGSGNSANIVKAVEQANSLGMYTSGVLGYGGGRVKNMLDLPIHFPINDMQISEDMQLIVGHMIMRALCDECK